MFCGLPVLSYAIPCGFGNTNGVANTAVLVEEKAIENDSSFVPGTLHIHISIQITQMNNYVHVSTLLSQCAFVS